MPLGRRTDYGEARFAGVEVDASADVERDLEVRVCTVAACMQTCSVHRSSGAG
jgi:hypothetical protein